MTHDPYALSDEDRLPWLEPVDEIDAPQRGLPLVLIAWGLAALALLAIAIGAVWWWQNREIEPSGTGDLIAAPAEPYKVRPAEEGGMKIEGQGDVVFQTSQGAQVEGALDLNAVPETPVDRAPAARPVAEPKAGKSASASVSEGTEKLVAKAPPAALAPEGPAGSTIQLGAYPSESGAKKSWDAMAKRFSYLADRSQMIAKAEVNGKTYYRLRVAAGSPGEAKDLCARLRIAGENCLVVN